MYSIPVTHTIISLDCYQTLHYISVCSRFSYWVYLVIFNISRELVSLMFLELFRCFFFLLFVETGGTYKFNDHSLEIPSLSDIDMDKNRLKLSAMGSLGGRDDIVFVIEQVPFGAFNLLHLTSVLVALF